MNQSVRAVARPLHTTAEESRFEVDALLQGANEAVARALAHEVGTTTGVSGRQDVTGGPGSRLRMSNSAKPPGVASLPPPSPAFPRRATFHALQEWEGYVVDIGDDEFVARLLDLTAGHSHESIEATIPLSEVSERDASRMAVGSIFRWVIGYERSVEGTRKRVSLIVFRDLPRMTESDLRKGRDWAESVVSAFDR